jgi:hypothetical protein
MSQVVCPGCGATTMSAGCLESTGVVRFRPLQTRFLTFRTGDIAVRAMMCHSCGFIAMIGDTDKLRILKGTQTQSVTQKANSPG